MEEENLSRLDSSEIDPERLMKKRLVIHYRNEVQMVRVIDAASRQLLVREIGKSRPFENTEDADWVKTPNRLISWLDLDQLVGVQRLQVFN